MLKDWMLLAATFTGTQMALVLHDETGIWHRDSSGLTSEQLMAVESILVGGPTPEGTDSLRREHGLEVLEIIQLIDINQRTMGALCALSPTSITLSVAQQEGLKLLAGQIQTFLTTDHQRMETRTIPRAPSAASFVPGLVHELGSFIFGISANLDAFEARFAELDEVGRYGANIRRSLDRMSAFNEELREYGDPRRLSWSIRDLEPILREALEHHKSLAEQNQIDLQLLIKEPLPAINADEQSLLGAFVRVIGLVVQQEEVGGRVALQVATGRLGNRVTICGHLDFSSRKFKDLDPARLFEPFYFRTSGLGRLTLPGARRVFESHGGTLAAGLGSVGGMTISFMLPTVRTYPLRSDDQS
jgi:signal transduction histidine kinase